MYKVPKREKGGKQCHRGLDGRGGAVAGQSLQAPPKFPASVYNKQLTRFLKRREITGSCTSRRRKIRAHRCVCNDKGGQEERRESGNLLEEFVDMDGKKYV